MAQERAFEPEEIVLAGRVLAMLKECANESAYETADHIRDVMNQLVQLRDVVTSYTSVITPQVVAGLRMDVFTLADAICRSNPYTVEAHIPTRAVVGRAYLVARFNFLRLLVQVVQYHMQEGPEQGQLAGEVRRLVRRAVITMITEDILVSIASDHTVDPPLRRKATYLLADLWEYRTARSVSDFFPILLSVWEAKARMTISYGTLSGTSEIMAMLREGCDHALLEYFSSDSISKEERQALDELVFNATCEELETMRNYMGLQGKDVLGPDDVASIFNIPRSQLHQSITCPEDMFFTYRERQVTAYHRLIHSIQGPKKTAEEYLVLYLLGQMDVRPPVSEADLDPVNQLPSCMEKPKGCS